jgi:hypothetical protein
VGELKASSAKLGAVAVSAKACASDEFSPDWLMINQLNELSSSALRKAADLKEQIEALQKELSALLGTASMAPAGKTGASKRKSAAWRKALSESMKARWAVRRAEMPGPSLKPVKKKRLSEARLNALAKAREARWAKGRAGKKSRV